MMKSNENKELIIQEMMAEKSSFQGYTIEQIRYQRALVALKKEFAKEKVMADIDAIRKRVVPKAGKDVSHKAGNVMNVVSYVAGKLNYLDYLMVAVSAFTTMRKIAGIFRRNKK